MGTPASLKPFGMALSSSPVETNHHFASHSHGPRASAQSILTGPRRQRSRSNLRATHTVRTTGAKMGTPAGRRDLTGPALRTKDSSDRVQKRAELPTGKEALASGREGKHFTVGNVGNNGRIYLRPMVDSIPPRERVLPTPSHLPSSAGKARLKSLEYGDAGRDVRDSIWSTSQFSELQPVVLREGSVEVNEPNEPESSITGSHHPRSRSFSTMADHERSSSSKRRGEFRIVIERFDDQSESGEQTSVPVLKTPIPHYRLGTPRFNAKGEPVLRSSLYTQTSLSDHTRSSVFLRRGSTNLQIPSTSPNWVRSRQELPAAMSMFSRPGPVEIWTRTSSSQKSAFYKLKEPIESSIFDALMLDMDSPSVVRYFPGTKDISAATPARIVAQISSESFMDYELVSDFFLTFRSYLSASNLLSLLMARLEWAINRLQEDGRIIRIRTFAALRHWILNYFVDDFVMNRDLRVQFCERINAMYEQVRGRRNGSASDLKILVDLKRCWHGRCSLYWDCPDLSIPVSAVVPGGVAGNRDFNMTGFTEFRTVNTRITLSANLQDDSVEDFPHPEATAGDGRLPHFNSHKRYVSSGTAHSVPMSPASDQSDQAVSCSFPAKSSKHSSSPTTPAKILHPVPVQTKLPSHSPAPRSSASVPGQRRAIHAHKRSGSFSDSVRDDRFPFTPAESDEQDQSLIQPLPYLGSLIRGTLLPPVQPYVEMIAPPSPSTLSSSYELHEISSQGLSDGYHKAGSSPSVRTIIGSIRRALHGKQGGHGSSMQTGNMASQTSTRGKTAALPFNVAFGPDTYGDRRLHPTSKSSIRIDLLGDQAMRGYREALGLEIETFPPNIHTLSSPEATTKTHQLDSEADHLSQNVVAAQPRPSSQVTMGSKSIVIVDDTGFYLPAIPGAIPWPPPDAARIRLAENEPLSITQDHPSKTAPASIETSSLSSQRTEELLSLSFLKEDEPAAQRIESVPNRLRKYASYQIGTSKYWPERNSEFSTSSSSMQPGGGAPKSRGRILRRRPGGDLRKIRNAHDLEAHQRPLSFVSDTSLSGSVTTSIYPVSRRHVSTPDIRPASRTRSFSLINTHSSQHMRPSFEAAVAEFSRIPDDEDGGVESTLLKLEGKWPRPSSSHPGNLPEHGGQDSSYFIDNHLDQHQDIAGQKLPPSQSDSESGKIDEREISSQPPGTEALALTSRFWPSDTAESEDSYSSIPLLERGLCDESMRGPILPTASSAVAAQRSTLESSSSRENMPTQSSHPSIQIVEKTDSLKRIPQGSTIPEPADFMLLQRGGSCSELSSELSVDVISKEETVEDLSELALQESQRPGMSTLSIPPHPLAHPPSPPVTIPRSIPVALPPMPTTPLPFPAQPLTPDPSPGRKSGKRGVDRAIDKNMHRFPSDAPTSPTSEQCGQDHHQASELPQYGHVPFILACDSQVLAQQLTLVEKSALDEIDWKDLVDMKWSNGSSSASDWAQYLSEKERKGIDLVVGRFNLGVKWALSEVVLTEDIHERARTVTKFIHIASHARRICNYSTMLQIAIALSSVNCTRLQRTWALVSPADKRVFKDMETLIQPVRNFHDLRAEMETATLQDGCIPFVGLYVQDLTYNAQKPAQIASTRDGEPLVNFDRYRTASRIVKCLLRLVDASSKYKFEPIHGIMERCLWISSLPEDKIQVLSKCLE